MNFRNVFFLFCFIEKLIQVFRTSLKIGQTPGFDDIMFKQPVDKPVKPVISLKNKESSMTIETTQDSKREKSKIETFNNDHCVYGGNEFCFIILNNFDRPSPMLPMDSNV
jgi:hypothetical protein